MQSRLLETEKIAQICGPNWEIPNDLGPKSTFLRPKYVSGYLYYCSLLGMINAEINLAQTKEYIGIIIL